MAIRIAGISKKTSDATYAPLGAKVTTPRGLRRWRAKRGKARRSNVYIGGFGHSIVVGAYANDANSSTAADQLVWAQYGWVGNLRALANARLGGGVGGEGWVSFGVDEGRWTFSGARSNNSAGPLSTGQNLAIGTTVSATLTYKEFDLHGYHATGSTYAPSRVTSDGTDITATALTATQAAFSTAAGNWANRTNCTPAHAVDTGEDVLTLTSAAGGAMSAQTPSGTSGFPVTAGAYYFLAGEFKAAATPQLVHMDVTWYDSGGAQLTQLSTPNVTDATAGYVHVSEIVLAPAGAAFGNIIGRVNTTGGASEVHTLRRARLIPLTVVLGQSSVKLYKFKCVAAADAAHALVIEAPSAQSALPAFVGGVRLRDATTGFVVGRVAKSGIIAGELVGRLQSDHTTANAAATAANLLSATVDMMAPDLALVMIGANEVANQVAYGTTPTQFRADVKTLTDRVTSLGGCSLLIADPRYPSETSPQTQQAFYDTLADIANTDDHVAYVDINDLWISETEAEAEGLMSFATTGIHPIGAGHGDIAFLLDRVLFGDQPMHA